MPGFAAPATAGGETAQAAEKMAQGQRRTADVGQLGEQTEELIRTWS